MFIVFARKYFANIQKKEEMVNGRNISALDTVFRNNENPFPVK